MPHRELYWNIATHWAIYPVFLPFAVACLYGCYRLLRVVRVGGRDAGPRLLRDQVRGLLDQALLQRRLLGQPFAGSVHAAISWGFAILFVATCLVAGQDYLGLPALRGRFYLYFMSLTVPKSIVNNTPLPHDRLREMRTLERSSCPVPGPKSSWNLSKP